MDWINLHTSMLRAPEYLGSEPTARATWLNVLSWCCTQENSGRITNCRAWKDRQWQQLCGVTEQEVNFSEPLLCWDDKDLIVWGYPVAKQSEVQQDRINGKKGGESRSEAKIQASRANGAKRKPSQSQANPKPEPNGMEWKGMEGNGKEPNIAPAKADAKARPRNELLDALATVGGGKADQIVPSKWSGIGKALADIKAVCPSLTVEEIQRRASNYRTHFVDAALTPFALASHWAICDSAKRHRSFDDLKIDRS
jgi:hypothetical protein